MPIQAFSRSDTPGLSLGPAFLGEHIHRRRVLLAPGLFGSGPDHWQSAWQRAYPRFQRVEQDDWTWPQLERWSRRVVETALTVGEPVIVVAHSFACLATARASLLQSGVIAGALLVAPAEPARFKVESLLPQTTLDFPTIMVASSDDPWMRLDSARVWAQRWGSQLVELRGAGHINVRSGYTDWPEGLALLERVCRSASHGPVRRAQFH